MISVSLFAFKILSLISRSVVAALLQKLDPIQQEDIAAVDVAKSHKASLLSLNCNFECKENFQGINVRKNS